MTQVATGPNTDVEREGVDDADILTVARQQVLERGEG
ncbi:MAG TPA: biotin synthase BioB, partial [Mycobacterium sp.]|nr:biotin synthase BioB [Mycobacterium sp.]